MNAELTTQVQGFTDLNAQLTASNRAVASLASLNEALTSSYDTLSVDHDSLVAKHSQAKADLSQSQGECSALREELNTCKHKVEQFDGLALDKQVTY